MENERMEKERNWKESEEWNISIIRSLTLHRWSQLYVCSAEFRDPKPSLLTQQKNHSQPPL